MIANRETLNSGNKKNCHVMTETGCEIPNSSDVIKIDNEAPAAERAVGIHFSFFCGSKDVRERVYKVAV